MFGTKLLNFLDLSKLAVKEVKAYQVREEYAPFINSLRAARVVLALISIFSGFCWFQVKFSAFFSSVALCSSLSFVCLTLLELCNKYLQSKLFKFALKKNRRKEALSMLLILSGFYFFSFYVSTQGISLYFEDVTKEVSLSNSSYKEEAERISLDYDRQINEVRENKSKVTPPAWNKGAYTTPQNEILREYDAQIVALEKERKQALSELKEERKAAEATITAKGKESATNYYYIVLSVMLAQLVVNFLITFFLNKIYQQENLDEAKEEEAESISGAIGVRVNNLVVGNLSKILNSTFGGLERAFLNLGAETEEEQAAPPASPRPVGKRLSSPLVRVETLADEEQPSPTDTKVKIKGFSQGGEEEDEARGKQEGTQSHTPPATSSALPPTQCVRNEEPSLEELRAANLAKCPICGKIFPKKTTWHKYDSEECKFQAQANRSGKPYTPKGSKITYYPQS